MNNEKEGVVIIAIFFLLGIAIVLIADNPWIRAGFASWCGGVLIVAIYSGVKIIPR